MSKYTTEVRFICERAAGHDESVGYDKVEEILEESWNKVFDFSFPIFDEDYRPVLCKKILKHYYTREIGFETVGLWKLKLNMTMNEIMPYYNKLYESEKKEFDPFRDADYYRDHEGSDAGSGNQTGSHTGTVGDAGTHGGTITDAGNREGEKHDVVNDDATGTSWDVYSDTPQGALTNVANETYLTNARKITNSTERDITTDSEYEETNGNLRTYNETTGNTRTFNEATGQSRSYSNTDEYLDHVYGKMPGKTYMSMLKELRDTFLNIDVDIIGDLSDLFLKLW